MKDVNSSMDRAACPTKDVDSSTDRVTCPAEGTTGPRRRIFVKLGLSHTSIDQGADAGGRHIVGKIVQAATLYQFD